MYVYMQTPFKDAFSVKAEAFTVQGTSSDIAINRAKYTIEDIVKDTAGYMYILIYVHLKILHKLQ